MRNMTFPIEEISVEAAGTKRTYTVPEIQDI